MQLHIYIYAVVMGLWLNCAVGQEPKPRAPHRPNIVLREDSLLLVMNSANITLRMIESREKLFTASFTSASIAVTPHNAKNMSATITFPTAAAASKDFTVNSFSLTFDFTKEATGGYWVTTNTTANLVANETGKTVHFKNAVLISDIGLYAPESHSFHCSRFGPLFPVDTAGGNHTFVVDLHGFQIQPFSNNTNKFSEAYECVGFFSIGILSGIFVTLILMAIIAWGLAMIMDVKTMDRFDDPKGKPISFGGTE